MHYTDKYPPSGGFTNSNLVRATLKPAPSAGFVIKKEIRTEIRSKIKVEIHNKINNLIPYKLAKLSNKDNADWFVYYYYIDPSTNKFKRFKERFGLNNFKKINELSIVFKKSEHKVRLIMAEEMINIINNNLKNGFNPFEKEYKKIQGFNLISELEKIVKTITDESTKTKSDVCKLTLSRFKKYVINNNIVYSSMNEVDVKEVEKIQDYFKIQMGLSKKSVNTTISYLGMFWSILKKQNKVTNNPFRQISTLKKKDYRGLKSFKGDDDIFEPLTAEELNKIVIECKSQNNNNFLKFISFIYYAWIRPIEITKIKVSDIDLKNDTIRLHSHSTKNKNSAYVQIVPPLKKIIQSMNLENEKNDKYIFSNNLMPGYQKINPYRSVTEKIWNPLVKKLGIKKKMYALKHTGNIEYMSKNKGKLDIKWQQMQNRHSSSQQTENYNRKLGAYFIDLKDIKFNNIFS